MKRWMFVFLALVAIIAVPALLAPSRTSSLILQAIGIFVSSIIAIAAIWGEQIKAIFAGPKLILSLYNEEGELIEYAGSSPARYYYLRLVNKRPGTIARDALVQIKSIQRKPSGIWQSKKIIYRAYLSWGADDYASQNIAYGAEACCGILSIYQGGQCSIASDIGRPYLDPFLEAGDMLRIEVMAVAENSKSGPLIIEISWDGQWSNSDQEMKTHLRIKAI